MKENIKISVIVPIYNCEKSLERCLKSLINQTYSNIEVILINDCSNDSSLNLCKKFKNIDSRIILINNEENRGVSYSRNVGIENCTGQYITFIDSDDYLELNTYENCVKILSSMQIDILKFSYVKEFGRIKIIKSFKSKTKNLILKNNYKKDVFNNIFTSEDFTSVWNFIIKKDILEQNQLKFDTNILFAEDFLFNIEVLKCSNNIYFMDNVFYHYVVNSTNATQRFNSLNIIKRIDNIIVSNTKSLNLLENKELYLNQYQNKVITFINEKLGLIAYYMNFFSYKKMIGKIVTLESFINFKNNIGEKNIISSSFFKYLNLKLKIGIKENIKKILFKI